MITAMSLWRAEMHECQARLAECEATLERVPPSIFKRVQDDLAECRQHLEEAEMRPSPEKGTDGLRDHESRTRRD